MALRQPSRSNVGDSDTVFFKHARPSFMPFDQRPTLASWAPALQATNLFFLRNGDMLSFFPFDFLSASIPFSCFLSHPCSQLPIDSPSRFRSPIVVGIIYCKRRPNLELPLL